MLRSRQPGDYEQAVYIQRYIEEKPMTLHVGMTTSDDAILVGDVRVYADVTVELPQQGVRESSVWHAEARSKITIADGGNIAIARAHDVTQSRLVTKAIADGLTRAYWNNPEEKLEELAAAALAGEPIWRGVHCLVALRLPSPSLFKIECAKDPTTQQNVCVCHRGDGYMVAGDSHNPSTFFGTRYLQSDPARVWTASELLPLAVQIVVDGGRVSSGPIGGLEIVCGSSSVPFHRLSVPERQAWSAEAMRRSEKIEKIVSSPFTATTAGAANQQ